MSKYKLLDNIVRTAINIFHGKNTIVGKPYKNIPVTLYYNCIDHLVFLGKPTISYETILHDKIKKYINQGDIVFDIGGNIGQYAMLFSHLVGVAGKVVSFEPDPANFAYLSLNKYKNNCQNLTLLNEGLGKTTGEITIYTDNTTGGRRSSMRSELVENSGQRQVKVSTLQEQIVRFGTPNFIKMDVEGFENEVLKGAGTNLLGEPMVWMIEVRSDTKNFVFEKFHQTHKCFVIDEIVNIEIHKSSSIPDFANLLFTPIVK